MLLLGCNLSDVTLSNELELILNELEVLENVEWSFGLPGENPIWSGAMAFWPSCTSLSFIFPGSLEFLFRPTWTLVSLEPALIGILIVSVS